MNSRRIPGGNRTEDVPASLPTPRKSNSTLYVHIVQCCPPVLDRLSMAFLNLPVVNTEAKASWSNTSLAMPQS
jgi:hypothetical protein